MKPETEIEFELDAQYFKPGDFLTNGKFVYKVTDADKFVGKYLYWIKTWDGSHYGPFDYHKLMELKMRPASEDAWKRSWKKKPKKRRRRVSS